MEKITSYQMNFSNQLTLQEKVHQYLQHFDRKPVYHHVVAVAKEARRLANRFGEDTEKAYTAGLLHDISAVIPNEARVSFSEAQGQTLFPEERQLPMILHQQQSADIARAVFHIHDEAVLSAIAVHTTLKQGASQLDKIVFIADKIAWDRPGTPPYLAALLAALDNSLDEGCLLYLDWLFDGDLLVAHPWAVAARAELAEQTIIGK